jgi:RES domain-containing protein
VGVTRLFRLCLTRFADSIWSGDGGLYADGRWHTAGNRIVYTASSLALAQLEVLVHIPRDSLPDLSHAAADITDAVAIGLVDLDE